MGVTHLRQGTAVAVAITVTVVMDTALSKNEIIEQHAGLEQLKLDMAARSAGGRSASGRYKRHDTARKHYIASVAMPSPLRTRITTARVGFEPRSC